MTAEPTLFDVPSGLVSPGNDARANTAAAYAAWRETADGLKVWQFLLTRAKESWHQGAKRISVNALVEAARQELKLDVNNTYRAWLSDDLVRAEPGLASVIERRVRRLVRP